MMLRCLAIFAFLPLVAFGKFLYPCFDEKASHLQNEIKWGFRKYFESEGISHVLGGVTYKCGYEVLTDHKGPYFLAFQIGKEQLNLHENEIADLIFKAVKEESKNAESALTKELNRLVDEALLKEEEGADDKPEFNVGCYLAKDGKYYGKDYSAFCMFSLLPPPPPVY